MRDVRTQRLSLAIAALALSLAGLTGCTTWQGGVTGFLNNRLKDTIEMADLGITVTDTPQFSFYAALLSIGPGGYGDVNGRFYGFGGGDIGAMKIQYKHVGLMVWGREEVGWGDGALWHFGDPDPNDPEKIHRQGVGIGGILGPPYDARPGGRPTCTKYFHIGYVGIVINGCFAQMMDAMSGWMGFDLAGDDNPQYKYGRWPWEEPRSAPKPPAAQAARGGLTAPKSETQAIVQTVH